MAYIEFKDVIKAYGEGDARIHALDGASFTVERGELAIILGASGAGKTTALNILGGMDTVTSGTVTVDGRDVSSANEAQLVEYRRADVGFVFQFYNLVPNLTALENVELAAQICPDSLDAEQTLRQVGLGERLGNFPAQLSGGEQQRVSIARALAKNPKLLLCDEPTGALDYKTGKQILQLLQDTCRKQGITVIIITHNSALAPMADRLIRFKSGRVESETVQQNPVPIETIECSAHGSGPPKQPTPRRAEHGVRAGFYDLPHCPKLKRYGADGVSPRCLPHDSRQPQTLLVHRRDHCARRERDVRPQGGLRGSVRFGRRLL